MTAINKLDGWTATKTLGADADTVDATGQATAKTVVDKLQVAALNPGANYNNLQVRLEGKVGLTNPIASYDAVKNELVIQVDTASTANSTFAKIVTAINGVTAGRGRGVQRKLDHADGGPSLHLRLEGRHQRGRQYGLHRRQHAAGRYGA